MLEKTLVILKPDCIKRNLVGEVIRRFDNAGLKICEIKHISPAEVTERKTNEHYKHIPPSMVQKIHTYLKEGIMIAMVLNGENSIRKVRSMIGFTDPIESLPGTIRADFGCDDMQQAIEEHRAVQNLIHASDSQSAFEKEYKIWFN